MSDYHLMELRLDVGVATEQEFDEAFGDGCQNLDTCTDWLDHDPHYEPDWEEERREEEHQAQLAMHMDLMPCWPALFGFPDGFVRCATFGRNPNLNPYTGKVVKPNGP